MHNLITMDELTQYSGTELDIVKVLYGLYARRNSDGSKPRARLYFGEPTTMKIGFHKPVIGHIDFDADSCGGYEPVIKANCRSECGAQISLSNLLRIEETRKYSYPNVLLWEAEGTMFQPYELFNMLNFSYEDDKLTDHWVIALADGKRPVAKGTRAQMTSKLDCYFGFRNTTHPNRAE